jgi:hypothetical protein
MIKNTLLVLILVLPTFAFIDIMSNGAPASSSGAPGEVNCTTSGCHTGYVLNGGSGSASLTIENSVTQYTPNATYTITAHVAQTGLTRFGFQLVALANLDNSPVGTLTVTDGSRTQVINGYGTFSNRNYITYTYPGTAAIASGLGEWSFSWTAPAIDKGPVTFYLATIAADNDGTDAGDYCYTKSVTLTSALTGITDTKIESGINVFPNPTADKITVDYVLEKPTTIKMQLFNTNGEMLEDWPIEEQAQGKYSKTITLNKEYPKGIYFFSFIKNGKNYLKKISIN